MFVAEWFFLIQNSLPEVYLREIFGRALPALSCRPNIRRIPSRIMTAKKPPIFSGYSLHLFLTLQQCIREMQLNVQIEDTD